MNVAEFTARLDTALTVHDLTRERSLQRSLGFSDLVCHEKARRKLVGAPPSDDPSRWAAQVGTAVHWLVGQAVAHGFDGALVERELTVKLPSGLLVTGHPDLILPGEPSVCDLKTLNGPGELSRVARHGPTEDQVMQVSLGYEAARQAALVPAEGLVRLFWRDRSGKSDRTVVWQERFDPAWVDKTSDWFDDAAYAAEHHDEAMKDPHWSWCRSFCEFFTDCRGGSVVFGPAVDDEELMTAARDHYESKQLEAFFADEKDAARDVLERLQPDSWADDVPTYQLDGLRLRWSWVNRSDLDDGGYARLEIDPIEKGD